MVTALVLVIAMRGSTCCKVFIVGAGAAVGESGPWAEALCIADNNAHRTQRLVTIRLFMDFLLRFFGDGLLGRAGWVWQNAEPGELFLVASA
jgi:hypothetical protein